jgi:hypothetical protein
MIFYKFRLKSGGLVDTGVNGFWSPTLSVKDPEIPYLPLEDAAGGAITGTGATSQAQTASGTAQLGHQGAGSTAQAQTAAGTGQLGHIGTGATSQAQTASGTGQLGHSGTGATSQAQTASGTGQLGHNATGATSQAQTVAGTGVVTTAGAITGTGATSQAQTSAGDGVVASNLVQTLGGVPWNPYRATGETEAQKETRRIAQGIIQRAKQPQADIPALFEEAREVSASIKADIARIEYDIQALLDLIEKRQTKLRLDALRKSQNDALAMRQMEMALIDLQLQAEAQAQQIEELDVVFMVVMLAAM